MSAFEEFSSSESELQELISRYESSLSSRESCYFDVDEYEDLATYYLQHNQLDRVKGLLDTALNCFPDAAELLLKKAQYLASVQNTQEALLILSDLEYRSVFLYDVFMIRGHVYSQMACSELAIEQFKNAIPLAEEPEDVFAALGIEFLNSHKASDALYYFKKALKHNPELDALFPDVFLCFEYTGRLKEAADYFNEATNQTPYSFHAWYYLGLAYLKQHLPEFALQAFDYALAIQDRSISVRIHMAQAQVNLEHYAQAITLLQEALEIDANDAQIYFSLAEVYYATEAYSQALIQYNKCIKRDPAWADAWMGIALVLDHLNRISEALHYIRKAVEINPQESEYWYVLAELQHKMGFLEEAEQAYQRVIECDYPEVDVWMDYGHLLIQTEQYEKALEVFFEGIKQFPKSGELFYQVSAVFLKLQQRQSSLEFLEKALQMDYSKHTVLTELIPQIRTDLEVMDLINSYKSKDSWV